MPAVELFLQTLRENLYMICKESITNVAKHSGADRVNVSMNSGSPGLVVRISDIGKGIDDSTRYNGQGLKNMQMRAKRIEATLVIAGDAGTTINITVPKLK